MQADARTHATAMPYPVPPVRFRKPPISPEECDAQVMQALVGAIVSGANPPDFAQLAIALELRRDEVCSSFQRLARTGEITLWPETHSIRLIAPFGAGSGDVTVGGAMVGGGARNWRVWGLWHALGIPAALSGIGIEMPQVTLRARDLQNGDPLLLRLSGPTVILDEGESEPVAVLSSPFHRWWNDPEAAISAVTLVGSARVNPASGSVIPLHLLCELAWRWHADRLQPHWHAHTVDQARALTDTVGLHSPEWQLHPG